MNNKSNKWYKSEIDKKKRYEATKRWRKRNRKQINIYEKKWKHKNKDKVIILRKKHMNNYCFSGNRYMVLERDGFKCVLCNTTNEEYTKTYKRELSIHHMDGSGRIMKFRNNNIDNLITLCMACHRKLHSELLRAEQRARLKGDSK